MKRRFLPWLFLLPALLTNLHASAQERQFISIWAVNCETLSVNQDINRNRWFIMDERNNSKPPRIFIGNSIKAIPYPGLHDVVDVRDDPRIEWLSDDRISVSNADKDIGWPGRITFHNCSKVH